ncbi:MAG: HD domain-containing protein [Nanoarchaeota archaeon]|nr:HD domain-containing protein [Nanoarchaeota archaeon]MBU1501354.1 HD domain-containing protein [Nanoarchaeota archaeon]MBU2458754.1 HD domain-containing protein [Nanoarchaeota archaeon]
MEENIIEIVKLFVEEECKKPKSKYRYDPFPYNLVPMVSHADKLCLQLGGDREVILIAAWLHDIGSIIHGREDHHITGAKTAEEKLKELQYPDEKIEQVKKCILNHRGSQQNERDSIEEQIIAEADVISNFDNIAGIFKAAFIEGKSQEEARKSARQKLQRKWNQLHFESSKNLIQPKYAAAMLLLASVEDE